MKTRTTKTLSRNIQTMLALALLAGLTLTTTGGLATINGVVTGHKPFMTRRANG